MLTMVARHLVTQGKGSMGGTRRDSQQPKEPKGLQKIGTTMTQLDMMMKRKTP
jgi:hypothetical protein